MRTIKQFYVNSFMAWMLIISITIVAAGISALKILEQPDVISQIPVATLSKIVFNFTLFIFKFRIVIPDSVE